MWSSPNLSILITILLYLIKQCNNFQCWSFMSLNYSLQHFSILQFKFFSVKFIFLLEISYSEVISICFHIKIWFFGLIFEIYQYLIRVDLFVFIYFWLSVLMIRFFGHFQFLNTLIHFPFCLKFDSVMILPFKVRWVSLSYFLWLIQHFLNVTLFC